VLGSSMQLARAFLAAWPATARMADTGWRLPSRSGGAAGREYYAADLLAMRAWSSEQRTGLQGPLEAVARRDQQGFFSISDGGGGNA
jgi:hypothetical protein